MRSVIRSIVGLLSVVVMAASSLVGTFIVCVIITWNLDFRWWQDFLFFLIFGNVWYWGGFFISNALLGLSNVLNGAEEVNFKPTASSSFVKRIKQRFDSVNQLTPAQVVKSVPSIWSRVPLAIYNGYYSHPRHLNSLVVEEAMISAMIGADAVVYGRNENTCQKEDPLVFAIDLYKRMKKGTREEKLSDATFALLLGEMLKGGSNITVELGTKAVELGYTQISQEIMHRLCSSSFPPSPELIRSLTTQGLNKAMNIT